LGIWAAFIVAAETSEVVAMMPPFYLGQGVAAGSESGCAQVARGPFTFV